MGFRGSLSRRPRSRAALSLPSALEGQAAAIILLNRWVRAAASLLNCDFRSIILSDAKIARVIARHNIPHAFLASERTLDKAPYGRDEMVILPDCRDRPDIHAVVDMMAGPATGCFYRRPLILDEGRAVSLLIFGERARPAFDARDLALVEEIAGPWPRRWSGTTLTRAATSRPPCA